MTRLALYFTAFCDQRKLQTTAGSAIVLASQDSQHAWDQKPITAFWEQCKLQTTAGSAALLASWLATNSCGAVTSCLMLQRRRFSALSCAQ